MSIRGDIRAYVAGLVGEIAPTFSSRGPAVVGRDTPFIIVYIAREPSETATIGDGGTRTLMRTPEISVEYLCEGTADEIENMLDEASERIEAAVFADDTLGGLVYDLDLSGVESDVSLVNNSERPVGTLRLNFTAGYSIPARRET